MKSDSTITEGREESRMGLIHTEISLLNPRNRDLEPLVVDALADTGAVNLCVPEHVVLQLQLERREERRVIMADGSKQTVPYVGPVEVRFGNRSCFTGALVLGSDVLLGAVAMEDMDLVLSPRTQSVVVNPESPEIPSAIVKRYSTARFDPPITNR